MKALKTMLLGIALILLGIAFNRGLSVGMFLGILGMCIVIVGYFEDREEK